MLRTYKFRLYPHARQSKTLNHLLDLSRTVYNAALEQRRELYAESSVGVTYTEQSKYFGQLRRQDVDGLGLLNFSCMQHTLRRLAKAFCAFFRRVKAGETPGYPRFKGRNRFDSYDDRRRALLYIQNVGEIKITYHRPIPDDAQIKPVIVRRSLGKWYVCFPLELPDPEITEGEAREVGIDGGLHSLLALSDGTLAENPRWLRNALAELGRRQRRKAAFPVAKQHEPIANQRRDVWHKITRALVDEYSLIAIEDLTHSFMTHNHHIALSARDAGLGLFRQLWESKVAETGSQDVVMPPAHIAAGLCKKI